MSSSILHQCPFCGHVSDVSVSLAAFVENPHCNQCGLSASESNGKMQDELANLFDRQMSMTSLPPQPTPQPISYSITQHYHHSSHMVSAPNQPPAPASSADDSTAGIMEILWQHGVDPSTLSPSQLDLFKHADIEQKQRLVQTWQLYIRSSSAPLPDTNQSSGPEDFDMDLSREEVEPYMRNGYDSNALPAEPTTGKPYARAKDPVYNSRQWWEVPQTGAMESQYGMFEEMKRWY